MTGKTPDMFQPYRGHPPHVAGSDTSKAAADSKKPTAAIQRLRVLAFIGGCKARGCTDEEIAEGMGIGGNSVRPRRRELELRGLIEKREETRPTRSGRMAVVWVAK